ncbi:MAG: TrmH family RNA methyltransferase [Cognaticolwellia sp.]|jgi:TrmH family RNA methyltransferase
MLSKAKLKYLNSLKSKKFRQKYNNFVAEGDKIAVEILESAQSTIGESQISVEAIFALPQWLERNANLIRPFQNVTTEIDNATLKKISNFQTPNQVYIILKQIDFQLNKTIIENNLTLLLDGIQDPGNLGTILRIADWFGIKNVICSQTCVELYNPKTIQSSMGAFLRIPTFRYDLVEFCHGFDNLPIYGAVLGGKNLFQSDISKKALIVIGNEGNGISDEMLKKLTHHIEIPANGDAESLNAAIATGIICAAFRNL